MIMSTIIITIMSIIITTTIMNIIMTMSTPAPVPARAALPSASILPRKS